MAIFALQPVAFGAWLVRIPEVQQALSLGPAELALALLGMPIGTLIMLPIASRLAARFGPVAIIRYGFLLFLALASFPVWATTPFLLFCALAALGASMSLLELGMNVTADAIERSGRRLIMTTCHGFWSVGIMLGALLGTILAALTVPPHWAVLLVAVASLPVALWLTSALPVVAAPDHATPRQKAGLPGKRLIGISVFVFGVTMTEGAMADWSALYLRDIFGIGAGSAGLGYVVFAGMVAAGRFIGDGLMARIGVLALARLCGGSALVGMVFLLLAPNVVIAVIGLGCIGVGVSVGFPIGVTAVAGLKDRPVASSVATLTFIALLGFLAGPPMIGIIAEYSNLRYGLGMLLPALLVSFALIPFLRSDKRPLPLTR